VLCLYEACRPCLPGLCCQSCCAHAARRSAPALPLGMEETALIVGAAYTSGLMNEPQIGSASSVCMGLLYLPPRMMQRMLDTKGRSFVERYGLACVLEHASGQLATPNKLLSVVSPAERAEQAAFEERYGARAAGILTASGTQVRHRIRRPLAEPVRCCAGRRRRINSVGLVYRVVQGYLLLPSDRMPHASTCSMLPAGRRPGVGWAGHGREST
jgi:hypothetical protein